MLTQRAAFVEARKALRAIMFLTLLTELYRRDEPIKEYLIGYHFHKEEKFACHNGRLIFTLAAHWLRATGSSARSSIEGLIIVRRDSEAFGRHRREDRGLRRS